MNLINDLKFNSQNLIPAIIQDVNNNEVLMMAYMNKESLIETLKTGKTHFYSRSRQKIWKKGETSGHTQTVKEILIDCDMDTFLIKVHQEGGACHVGYRSCFFRKVEGNFDNLRIIAKKVFDPEKVYE